jgi:hypothetical protein
LQGHHFVSEIPPTRIVRMPSALNRDVMSKATQNATVIGEGDFKAAGSLSARSSGPRQDSNNLSIAATTHASGAMSSRSEACQTGSSRGEVRNQQKREPMTNKSFEAGPRLKHIAFDSMCKVTAMNLGLRNILLAPAPPLPIQVVPGGREDERIPMLPPSLITPPDDRAAEGSLWPFLTLLR